MSYHTHPGNTRLTEAQAKHLLRTALDHPLEALVTLALFTGMRRGELLALRWQDIDMHKHQVHVCHSVELRSGTRWSIASLKADDSRRVLLISDRVLQALARHRARQQEQRIQAGAAWQDHDLIFCDTYGDLLDPLRVHADLTALLEQAGLPRLGFHGLRNAAHRLRLWERREGEL